MDAPPFDLPFEDEYAILSRILAYPPYPAEEPHVPEERWLHVRVGLHPSMRPMRLYFAGDFARENEHFEALKNPDPRAYFHKCRTRTRHFRQMVEYLECVAIHEMVPPFRGYNDLVTGADPYPYFENNAEGRQEYYVTLMPEGWQPNRYLRSYQPGVLTSASTRTPGCQPAPV